MSHLDWEKEISNFWKKSDIFKKSVDFRPKDNQFVFYDGPPFATGLPHYGHILGLTSKDLFPRYWTMKGYRCERKWGWDCHGLPIENIAEKELEIKKKNQIVEFGIDKFNNFCRNKVLFYASEWKKTVDRMGKWIEFDDSYKTMDTDYMESIWFIFKKLYDTGFIYEGKKILMYCPRCETPIAKAEIAMDNDYKDVTEETAIAKFKLIDEDSYLIAWTTTPWTLIGNVAIAINPKLTYARVKYNDEVLILAKDRLEVLKNNYEIINEFKGKELIGKYYAPLYNVSSDKKKSYLVIDGGDEVKSDEGTGMVHMAIYGEFDYEMIKKNDLSIIQHINDSGKLDIELNNWKGTWFKKLDAEVINDLNERNLLHSSFKHTHSYPFCYRCKTPLMYNAVNSWFVNIDKAKKRLLKNSKSINWRPEGKVESFFENIIKTAPDWTISRNRFWATAIPVWKCNKCNEVKVLGSIKELKESSVDKLKNDSIDLHKDFVDKIKLKCNKCSGTMSRIPEVIDCWFESGSMPYASKHYPFENEEFFNANYPCDFVSEYIGQVRAWFYYMHVIGTLVFDKAPFKNVLVSGNILAADGTKMSKSKNNYPNPDLLFDKYGADALRFFLMSSSVIRAQDINFKEELVGEVYRKVIMILSNVLNFYKLFKNINSKPALIKSENVLDKWILSKLTSLIKETTFELDRYNPTIPCELLTKFVNDLSTWYVRRSRDRLKNSDSDALSTFGYVLLQLSKLMAPITPFISELIYQELRLIDNSLKESVHLDNWPNHDAKLKNAECESLMDKSRQIVSMALDERDKSKIPIRQALSKLTVNGTKLPEEYCKIIIDEINVKSISFKESKELSVKLDTNLTPELIKEGLSREIIRKLNDLRKNMNLTINNKILLSIDIKDDLLLESFKEHQKNIMLNIQADKVIFESLNNCEELRINGKIFFAKIKVI
jgi:isoleucyl-tRNA synthetase